MSLNTDFNEIMESSVATYVANASVNQQTGHATFAAPEFPEGISQDSLNLHVGFINNTTAQVEAATAQIARTVYAADNNITNVSGTLDLGCLQIQAQHVLKQEMGDTTLYGQSVTAVDYIYGDELSAYRDQFALSASEEAAKLFS